MHSASRSDVHRGRALRAAMTDPEIHLWVRLRGRQLDGFAFRRQIPMGPYVVDFVCFKARLVIEVAGGQHSMMTRGDGDRTCWLESRGFRVLRFWNPDVRQQTEAVLQEIRAALHGSSPRITAGQRN